MPARPQLQKLSVGQIRELIKGPDCSEDLLEAARRDERVGVRRLAAAVDRKRRMAEHEKRRLERMLAFERSWAKRGFRMLAGVDEVGRGPLAGPVVAACVIIPFEEPLQGVDDSKKLTPEKRTQLDAEIRSRALGIGIAALDAAEIDRLNIHRASLEAMKQAIEACAPGKPDCLLIDAMKLPQIQLPQMPLVHGDERSYLIAAASIVAKVHRDRLMVELGERYPHYDFASNKGYGTADHMDGLEKHGPCEIHRRSFAPVMGYLLPSCRLYLEEIGRCSSIGMLRRAGLRIRSNCSHLTDQELERLRQAFRERLGYLGHPVDSATGP